MVQNFKSSPVPLTYIITFFLIPFIINGQELSLSEAHNLMLEFNGDLTASNYETKAAEEELKATNGLRYPSVNVIGTYATIDDDISLNLNPARDLLGGIIQLPDPGAVLGNWDITLQERNFGFAVANVTWPVFTGGKINAATEAATLKSELSKEHHHIKEDTYTIQLIDYYYKLKLAMEAENLREQVYKTIEIHNEHAEKLLKNGIIPEVETLNAKVALSNAKRELKAAAKDVSLATTAIENILGGNNNLSGLSTDFSKPIFLEPLEVIQEEMVSHNKQLQLVDFNKQLAQVGLKAEQSDYIPNLALYGGYNMWTDNLPLFEDQKWFAGVGLTWDIFDGFKREHQIQASKYVVNQVEEIEKQARLNIFTYTEKLYNEIEKHKEQYESLTADEALAKKLKFMRDRAFEEGTGTSLEVVDATLKLSEIELKKLQALYHYNSKLGELMVHLNKTSEFLNLNN